MQVDVRIKWHATLKMTYLVSCFRYVPLNLQGIIIYDIPRYNVSTIPNKSLFLKLLFEISELVNEYLKFSESLKLWSE